MMRVTRRTFLASTAAAAVVGCESSNSGPAIGLSFETLQTEYWVASFDTLRESLKRRGRAVLEAVADGDVNRQLEQVNSFLVRGVEGTIVAPKDADAAVPLVRAANAASVPIVFYNRPPAANDGKYVAVQADNFAIAKATVSRMAEEAKRLGRRCRAMILIGDLADQNSIARRDGFDAALEPYADSIAVAARVPTDWDQGKARAGAIDALRSDPDIDFVFTSSDFLFPSLVAALRESDKYHPIGHNRHVILGGFDGDATAYRMLRDGYLDADGVQDMAFECDACVQAIVDLHEGKQVSTLIRDEGFVAHQGNLDEAAERMWGAKAAATPS